jgi:hypothetical protein
MDIQEDLKTIVTRYKEKISSAPDDSSNIESLFNILKHVGLFFFSHGFLDENLKNEIQSLFKTQKPVSSEIFAPSFIDFHTLQHNLELFKSIKPDPLPRVPLNHDTMNDWENKTGNLMVLGMELLEKAIEINAVLQAERILDVSRLSPSPSSSWRTAWQRFKENSDDYINTITGAESNFSILSDEMHAYLLEYFCFPEKDPLFQFMKKIVQSPQDSAKRQFYRKGFSASEARELYEHVKQRHSQQMKVSSFYLFKSALAQETIKLFIRQCYRSIFPNKKTDQTNLETNLDKNPVSEIPFIRSAKKSYSAYILGDGLEEWGIRKDPDAMTILNDGSFDGAMFCSVKQYPDGAWFVSFDSYIEKEHFFKLINEQKSVFVRLPYPAVCERDDRDGFLQKAAEMLETNVDSEKFGGRQISEDLASIWFLILSESQKPIIKATEIADRHQFEDKKYYVPVKSFENKKFLAPNDGQAPESVKKLLSKAVTGQYFYQWRLIKQGDITGGKWEGPSKIESRRGITLGEIPTDIYLILFLIGPETTFKNLEKNQFESNDKLYLIIYGPEI